MNENANHSFTKRDFTVEFDDISLTYDKLLFAKFAALRLVELTALASGQQVLDVATGTGWVAFKAAQKVGPTGSVTGVDISSKMMAFAKDKTGAAVLRNVKFQEGDAARLDFADNKNTDAILCASALFFSQIFPRP